MRGGDYQIQKSEYTDLIFLETNLSLLLRMFLEFSILHSAHVYILRLTIRTFLAEAHLL